MQLLFPVYLVCTLYNIYTVFLKDILDDSAVKILECERDSGSLVFIKESRKMTNSDPVIYMPILVYRDRIHDVLLWDSQTGMNLRWIRAECGVFIAHAHANFI